MPLLVLELILTISQNYGTLGIDYFALPRKVFLSSLFRQIYLINLLCPIIKAPHWLGLISNPSRRWRHWRDMLQQLLYRWSSTFLILNDNIYWLNELPVYYHPLQVHLSWDGKWVIPPPELWCSGKVPISFIIRNHGNACGLISFPGDQ